MYSTTISSSIKITIVSCYSEKIVFLPSIATPSSSSFLPFFPAGAPFLPAAPLPLGLTSSLSSSKSSSSSLSSLAGFFFPLAGAPTDVFPAAGFFSVAAAAALPFKIVI